MVSQKHFREAMGALFSLKARTLPEGHESSLNANERGPRLEQSIFADSFTTTEEPREKEENSGNYDDRYSSQFSQETEKKIERHPPEQLQ